MGYTHYWSHQEINSETWDEICADVRLLIDTADVPVAGCYDSPIFREDDAICFNGIRDDEHETFVFTRSPESFNFCKTARKPYDLLVAAVLAVAKDYDPDISVRSDGDLDDQEWIDALAFASETLMRPIAYPVKEEVV